MMLRWCCDHHAWWGRCFNPHVFSTASASTLESGQVSSGLMERYLRLVATLPGITNACTLIGCLRYTKLCWVGKYINITMKPTNSPTQGQPNPEKNHNRLKVAFGRLFVTAFLFRGLGLILYRKQTTRNPTQPNSPQMLFFPTRRTDQIDHDLDHLNPSLPLWDASAGSV